MDIAESNIIQNVHQNFFSTIRARDLLKVFDEVKTQIQVLSLDCFDTLLWRKTAYPKDVFYDLQQHLVYRALGITAMQRIAAETQVRRIKFTEFGTSEVHLKEIYKNGFPSLTSEQVNDLVAAEIACESKACYAFPPVLELMRYAHANHKKIIIVSNTYLNAEQLKKLLSNVLPTDIFVLIDQIFCSSDYGHSKGDGLFNQVLAQLNLPANQMFHLGDNKALDCTIPAALGITTAHLGQFDPDVMEWIRLHSLAATLTDVTIHDKRPLYHIYRGLFSTISHAIDKPETLVGYLSFGPIMYAFAHFLKNEIEALKAQGKTVKVLFLMRDAYLLHRTYEALFETSPGQCVRISRFSSIAASFKIKDDVIRYLSANGYVSRFHEVCEQLLLPTDISEHLIATAMASPMPVHTFNQLMLSEDMLKNIFSRSAIFRRKLLTYLHSKVQIQAGDTVVLVDVGYIGRTQRVLTPILLDDLNVKEVMGRYLISMNIPEWQHSRSGLIDPSWCDDRVMSMLSANLSLFEEVCNSCDQSVRDYTNEGEPIFSPSSVTDEQRQRIQNIQNECLRFMQEANEFFNKSDVTPSMSTLRATALYEMVRREYFPMVKEIHYFKAFRHDKNKSSRSGFDSFAGPEKEYALLRRRGLCFSEQHAYGLRAAHMSYSLTVLAQRRFGFEMTLEDLSIKRELLTVITLVNQKPVSQVFPAIPTDEGFYSLWFPLGKGHIQTAILFGLNYQYFQLESADVILKRNFYRSSEHLFSQSVLENLVINQLINKGKNLFECQSKSGSIIFAPPTSAENADYIFRIVFRPVLTQS